MATLSRHGCCGVGPLLQPETVVWCRVRRVCSRVIDPARVLATAAGESGHDDDVPGGELWERALRIVQAAYKAEGFVCLEVHPVSMEVAPACAT